MAGAESKDALALEVCVALYVLACAFALLQSAMRHWMDAERSELAARLRLQDAARRGANGQPAADDPDADGPGAAGPAREPLVSELDKSRLFNVSSNFALAFLLRVVWLVLSVERVAPAPKGDAPTCSDYHTLVSACNRLSQLLCFTAYSTVVALWANVLGASERAHKARRGLSSEREIAAALAQSTLRRRPGDVVVAVPDLLASERVQSDGAAALADASGLNAICSLLCVLLTPQLVVVLLNFWCYVTIAVLLSVQWLECDPARYRAIDRAQTVAIAVFFVALGLLFLRYGVRLVRLLAGMQSPVRGRLVRSTVVVTGVSAVAFLLRGVLFMLTPVFGVTLSGAWATVLYPWFFYPVPELLPALLMLHLMTPRPRVLRAIAAGAPLNDTGACSAGVGGGDASARTPSARTPLLESSSSLLEQDVQADLDDEGQLLLLRGTSYRSFEPRFVDQETGEPDSAPSFWA